MEDDLSKGNTDNNYFIVTPDTLQSPPGDFVERVNSYFGCSDYQVNIAKMQSLATGQNLTGVCFLKDDAMRFIERTYPARNEMVLSFAGNGATSTVVIAG